MNKHIQFSFQKLLIVFGVISIMSAIQLLNTQPVAAASNPTYTLNAGSSVTAQGGFLTDNSGSIIPTFYKDGSTWKFLSNGQPTDAASYVNASKQEVSFKYDSNSRLYITHVNYVSDRPLQTGPGSAGRCYAAIKVSSPTSSSFVGVNGSNKETSACTNVVKGFAELSGAVNFASANISSEQFLGVTIPTCSQTPGSSAYGACVAQRQAALKKLASAISCNTSSASGLKECSYNKAIQSCLVKASNRSVTYCTNQQKAQAILNGDLSDITAETTDSDIAAICRTLATNQQQKCVKAATAERDKLKGESSGEATTCAIDNIGWIICPVVTFMAKVVDQVYGVVASLLTVSPITQSGGGKALFSAWAIMRNIANVAFVIAFLIIIYSQITSVGVSNYGIKKLLPKIFIAAILVNTSYWLCAIAVDVSNILGASLYNLFNADTFTKGLDTTQFAGDFTSTAGGTSSWLGISAAILASTAILYLAIGPLLIALVAAIAAIVTVFLVLALRQVLIILLIVVAPLAFVALLLPNTEEWFKKWRQLLQILLLMFPIIALIFGASGLASTIVMASAADVEGDGKIVVQLMGALITILPLAITPIIMKLGGGILSRFGGIINNPNKGPFDRMRKGAEAIANAEKNRRGIGALNGKGLSKVTGAPSRFMSRRRGQFDALDRRKKAADTIFGSTDLKTSAYERGALKDEDSAGLRKQVNEAAAKIEHIDGNLDLHVRAKVADMDLEAVKSEQSATLKEISTESGAAAHPEIADHLKTQAREAAEASHLNEMRTNSAGRIQQIEQAKSIMDNARGEADYAGGIDSFGATRASAQATQSVIKSFTDAADIEQSTMSNLKHDDLMNIVKDSSASEERRAAAAGKITSNSYRDGHLELIDYLADPANGAGTKGLENIQQQAFGDMKSMPLIMGDTQKGEMSRGQLTITPRAGLSSIREELMLRRLEEGKVSTTSFASMDPDEVKVLSNLHAAKKLNATAQNNIDSVIDLLRADPTAYQPTKLAQRKIHDNIHS